MWYELILTKDKKRDAQQILLQLTTVYLWLKVLVTNNFFKSFSRLQFAVNTIHTKYNQKNYQLLMFLAAKLTIVCVCNKASQNDDPNFSFFYWSQKKQGDHLTLWSMKQKWLALVTAEWTQLITSSPGVRVAISHLQSAKSATTAKNERQKMQKTKINLRMLSIRTENKISYK